MSDTKYISLPILTVIGLMMSSSAFGQYGVIPADTSGITVQGTGEARTVPDVVEFNLKLNARGELTDDAVVKHKDTRKRAMETFQTLKLQNLKLEERDLSLRPGNQQEMMQMMWNGMPPAQNKRTPIEVGSTLRARLTGIDKMPVEELMSTIGKLLDAAQDSGVALGMSDADMMAMRYYGYSRNQQALVKFVVTNTEEIREKAYDLAVKDARRRAEQLARLNGVKLGPVLLVSDHSSPGGMQQMYNPYGFDPSSSSDENKKEVVADTLSGGKYIVNLTVRYAISSDAKQAEVDSKKPDATAVARQEKSP